MNGKGTSPISVILVDDHNLVRRGLAALLEMDGEYRVVAEAENGEDAVQCAEKYVADVMILDLAMPRLNGLETIRRLHRHRSKMKILVLSMYDDAEFVVQALRDGASGYILKQSLDDELFDALTAILAGEQYTSAGITITPMNLQSVQFAGRLTSREHEVLQLIAEGHTATEIAELMSISPHTANRHRANIMEKLQVRNQMELIRVAVERGYVILKQSPSLGS